MGAKKRKKQAKRIKKIIRKSSVDWDDIVLAGLGTLSRAAKKDKRKLFTNAVKRGIDVVEMEIPAVDRIIYEEHDKPVEGSDPVISYSPHGGGWFNVEIDGQVVERVKGEEESAARAGELLEAFAALDPEEQADRTSGIFHTGGGWYTLKINGVPVDKVRGEDKASDRMSDVEDSATAD